MSAHGTGIWVVISDGANTRICSCQDGSTTPITTPLFDNGSVDFDVRAYQAWFKAERATGVTRNLRRQHILHVSQLLLEGARERAYNGLVIIVAEPVAREFQDALAPETRALLIGNVVRDYSILEPASASDTPVMRH